MAKKKNWSKIYDFALWSSLACGKSRQKKVLIILLLPSLKSVNILFFVKCNNLNPR